MIEVENLTKQFGTKRAVDNLTFTVQKGEVLGFLGPNGAGKSTTMRMITGFIPPTSGDAKVCGISIIDNPGEAKTKIGYLPESAPLYNDMTVIGFLKFCAAIRGLEGHREKRRRRARHRHLLPRHRRQAVHRHPLQRLPPPHLPRPGPAPRPGSPDPRRADRRPRPEPEIRSPPAHQAARKNQGHPLLHPHPRGSRSRLHPRRHRGPGKNRRRRHPRRTARPVRNRLAHRSLPQGHHPRHRSRR